MAAEIRPSRPSALPEGGVDLNPRGPPLPGVQPASVRPCQPGRAASQSTIQRIIQNGTQAPHVKMETSRCFV